MPLSRTCSTEAEMNNPYDIYGKTISPEKVEENLVKNVQDLPVTKVIKPVPREELPPAEDIPEEEMEKIEKRLLLAYASRWLSDGNMPRNKGVPRFENKPGKVREGEPGCLPRLDSQDITHFDVRQAGFDVEILFYDKERLAVKRKVGIRELKNEYGN